MSNLDECYYSMYLSEMRRMVPKSMILDSYEYSYSSAVEWAYGGSGCTRFWSNEETLSQSDKFALLLFVGKRKEFGELTNYISANISVYSLFCIFCQSLVWVWLYFIILFKTFTHFWSASNLPCTSSGWPRRSPSLIKSFVRSHWPAISASNVLCALWAWLTFERSRVVASDRQSAKRSVNHPLCSSQWAINFIKNNRFNLKN